MVVVFATSSDIEASVGMALLDSHGIEAIRASGNTQGIWPMAVSALGMYYTRARSVSAYMIRNDKHDGTLRSFPDLTERYAQYALWNAKKVAKAVGGEHWLAMRKMLLARRASSV